MAATDELEISMDADSTFYWEGTKQDQLLVQRCRVCAALRHPAGPACPRCRSLEWDAEPAPTSGTLHSVAKVHYPASPMQGTGYLICLVDLADGVRVATNLRDCELEGATIGMTVELCFEPIAHGFKLPQFRPAHAGATSNVGMSNVGMSNVGTTTAASAP